MRPVLAAIGLGGLASFAAAEDLLFAPAIGGTEKFTIIGTSVLDNGEPMLNMTVLLPSEEEWRAMTTDDFKKFKAIIFGDKCVRPENVAFIDETKDVWSAAITGNVAILGIEPLVSIPESFRYEVVQKNMINFAAGGSGTGLYYALPCHDDGDAVHTVNELSHFGPISIERNPSTRAGGSLTNNVKLVATSDLFITLDTSFTGDFTQDVPNIFIDFPTSGAGGFVPTMITDGSNDGSRNFADGSKGAPFVITRGATPVGCLNAVWEGQFGEECDPKVAALSNATDVCNLSCKCLKDFPGVCPPPKVSSSSASSSAPATPSGGSQTAETSGSSPTETGSVVYPNATATGTHSTATGTYLTATGTYSTGITKVYPTSLASSTTTAKKDVCGIEVIFIIEIIEVCPPGQTVTTTTTKTISTMSRDIYRTKHSGYPCFGCMLGDPTDEYTTVFYDLCPTKSDYVPIVTAQLCHSCQFSTYTTTVIPGYTPGPCNSCSTYIVQEKDLGIPSYTQTYNPVGYTTKTTSSGYMVVTAAAPPQAARAGVLGLLGGLAVAAAL